MAEIGFKSLKKRVQELAKGPEDKETIEAGLKVLFQSFEQAFGTTKCREIHENVIFGRYYNTADIEEGYPSFVRDKGFEKCGLPPGIGARIAARIIIEDMEKRR